MKTNTMIVLAALVCGLLMVGGGVWAMSSGSYAIDWDVIGGGGEPASSTNYAIRSTVGQPAAESSFSTNYKLWSGYWYPAVISIITPTVNGQVAFQGRPDPPDPSWVKPLTVVALEQGTSNVVGTYAVTTDNTGAFSFVFEQALGTYNIGVKGSHTLSRLEGDVVIDSATTNVDFGTLLEGDCNNSDIVNIYDFGLLADAFASVPASANWDERADLNNNDVVDIYDFGLLADNFGLSGEMVY